jgi:hypothetical protein
VCRLSDHYRNKMACRGLVYEGCYLDSVISLEKTEEVRHQKRVVEEWVGLVEKCRKNEPGRQRLRGFALLGVSTEITLLDAQTHDMLQRHRIPVADLARRYTITKGVNKGSLAKTRHVFTLKYVNEVNGTHFVKADNGVTWTKSGFPTSLNKTNASVNTVTCV